MHHSRSRFTRIYLVAGICLLAVATAAAKPAAAWFAELSSFRIGNYSVTQGSSATGVATLTSTTKSPIPTVAFTSSAPAVASVPATKAASSTGIATVSVTAVAPGCARITAAYGGRTRSADIVVHPVPGTTSFALTVPDQYVVLGGTSSGNIYKRLSVSGTSATGSEGTLTIERATIYLSSSNPSVAAVPRSVTQSGDNTSFSIKGAGDGCAIITARIGTQSIRKAVRVVDIGG